MTSRVPRTLSSKVWIERRAAVAWLVDETCPVTGSVLIPRRLRRRPGLLWRRRS
jgi:hypothetical protein